MRSTAVKILVLISVLTTLALSLPNTPPALQPYPGTGMFLMLSDIHFDPYTDPAIIEQLGAKPTPECQTPGSPAFSNFGSDTNYPLLKSTLDNVAATARQNHLHYDYVMVTGDFLSHDFAGRYHQCVGGGEEAYGIFASATIGFVESMIAKALPGVPVFAALGNNDSDRGDYVEPSDSFLQSVGHGWSRAWGNLRAGARAEASASFERAGNYAVPHPTVPNHELVIVNSNFWSAHHPQACSESDPDPGGQFQWLEKVLGRVKQARGAATMIMHIPPGIDALRSSAGAPQSFWTDACTQKLMAELTGFPGVVREIYAGHIHRDDFRLFPGPEGKPLCAIHIIPAVSPIYLDNPAVKIGWYDKSNGELTDYATLYLDLANPKPAWATEYIFTRAYGRPRPNLAALTELSREIRAGNPSSGVGKQYANFYGAGISIFLTPDDWSDYSCAQTEISISSFALCKHDASSR